MISLMPALNSLDVDGADEVLRETPVVFNVDPSNQLSFANYFKPTDRYDGYEVSPTEIETKEGLLNVSSETYSLCWEIYEFSCTQFPEIRMDDNDYESVERLVNQLNEKQFFELHKHVHEWFSDEFDGADHYEEMPYNTRVRPLNGYDAAYRLFAGYSLGDAELPDGVYEDEIEELFEIRVIEGEHPGSSYYAAELAITIEEANKRAAAHDMPVQFQHT